MVRSEMEVVSRCENYVQVDSLTVVNFTMLYVVWLLFHCWCHAPVVIIVSRFIVGFYRAFHKHANCEVQKPTDICARDLGDHFKVVKLKNLAITRKH